MDKSINDFAIDGRAVFAMFKEKGIKNLFHANTVLTSLSYIESSALLSRGHCESNNLKQTPQKSDNEDKFFDVWDDVFLDGFDLHEKYSRYNEYGPVLFVFKLAMLNNPGFNLHITKTNPWYWKTETPLNERYYDNIEEIEANYLTNKKIDARIMFTIKKPMRLIKLKKYLEKIIIDTPSGNFIHNNQKIHIGSNAYDKILASLKENSLSHIPLEKRHNGKLLLGCWCLYRYKITTKEKLVRLFRNQ